jgi:hypothetical protein
MLRRGFQHSLSSGCYPIYILRSHYRAGADEHKTPTLTAPQRPSNIWEIIQLLLSNGYTMAMIRTMYPGLFL